MSELNWYQQLINQMESLAAAGDLPLASKATDIVPSEGSLNSDVVFIGEAPGFTEAQQRRPFVGRSGQLLRLTLNTVGIDPASVYIANIVKVRPPENRDPTPEEIAAFKPFLDTEINQISPKLIVTLGRFSMAKFLPAVFISQVHGRVHKVKWHQKSLYIFPLYHPAAALRSTAMKTAFTTDLQKLPKIRDWVQQAIKDQAETQAMMAELL